MRIFGQEDFTALINSLPLSALETVAADTPAIRAISIICTFLLSGALFVMSYVSIGLPAPKVPKAAPLA